MFALALNPEPLAVTVVPTGPLVGFIVAVDKLTKLALIAFVPSLAVIAWLPPALPGTLKLALKLPFASLVNGDGIVVTFAPS